LIPSTAVLQLSPFLIRTAFTLLDVLTFLPVVINIGLGRDIWTVPFDNITLMFKVCYVQYKPTLMTS